eukprot:TRINITY_DN5396_c0_g1_i2.p1 TRINITY_DN5396_c0_g1~~TRINITY_DN5396_c0_g1_i2.p1  ORF type:complete len:306 (-),score=96.00 TRINITY_DN5396_c0_g1_i2:386-1303(-)
MQPEEKNAAPSSLLEDQKEAKNFRNFNSNVKNEASEDLKSRINAMSIENANSDTSTMAHTMTSGEVSPRGLTASRSLNTDKGMDIERDLSSYVPPSSRKEKERDSNKTVIEVKKFNKKTEKIFSLNLLDKLVGTVQTFIGKNPQDHKWKITNNVVTYIVEVNYNHLLSEIERNLMERANDITNQVKIRLLQPAHDFYNQLMDIWIVLKTSSTQKEIGYREYHMKCQKSFGGHWSDKLIKPTQLFFLTMKEEWNAVKDLCESQTEDKCVKLFIRAVRERMLKVWNENVVDKAETFNRKRVLSKTDQ